MTNKLVVVDFAGTLIKNEVIQEANKLRANTIKRSLPTKDEHANEQTLYKNNQEALQAITGLNKNITATSITYEDKTLTAQETHNTIATTLFQLGLYEQAHKQQKNIYAPNILQALKTIKERGYELAIVSGVRTDIITGVLTITGEENLFDYVHGQPPQLGISNTSHLRTLASKAKIAYVIGDKTSDLEPAAQQGATTILVSWGTPTGDEKPDYTANDADELINIIT